MKTKLLIALLFLSFAPLSFSQSQGRGGGGGAIAATEQTVGDANVTSWTAGTVRRTAAMTAARTAALPLAASLSAGSRVMYVDKVTGASSAFICTILASGSDTVAGDISYAPFPGPGTMEFETDGVSAWTPVSDVATSASFRDPTDPAKQGSVALGGNTTATNRVMTWRDYNFTPVSLEGTNIFTSAASLDMSALSPTAGLTLPTAGSAAPTAAGVVAYDNVTSTIRYGLGGTTGFVASRQGSETIKNKTFDNTNILSGYIAATEIAAPSNASANSVRYFGDSTDHRFHDKNNSGTVGTTVVADTGASNNFVTAVSAAGVISKAQPSVSNLSDGTTLALLAANTFTGAQTLFAGTTSLAPLNFVSGTNRTTPAVGAIEFDGTSFYDTIETTSGRGQIVTQNIFRLTADGSAIGPTIADYFGTGNAFPTVTNGIYLITYDLYFLKTTAGTVTFTITNTQTYTNIVAAAHLWNSAGIASAATAAGIGIDGTTTAAAALPATASLTTAVEHHVVIRALAECATAGNIRLQVTIGGGGTVTPRRDSMYTVQRLPAGNVGTFVN